MIKPIGHMSTGTLAETKQIFHVVDYVQQCPNVVKLLKIKKNIS